LALGGVNFGQIIKHVVYSGRGEPDLSEEDAHGLFSAILDGGVPDLELGALLAVLRMRTGSATELLGFYRAMNERLYTLQAPAGRLGPLVIPAYGGARSEHNLLPLLGLLLRRLGVPVLFHGTLEGSGRVACVYILRELGIMPSASLAHAQKALDDELLAFVPVAALCPGLASLLALRHRLGVRNSAHIVAKLIEPFEGRGVRLSGAGTPEQVDRLGAFFAATGLPALLLRSTDGEPFADPRRRPKIEWFDQGERHILFAEEAGPDKPVPGLPASIEAHATAAWIKQALAGEVPIPHPLVNQLACCLYVCGYTEDMNQAKAIAAVETGSLGPVGRRRPQQTRSNRAAPR
jgi:anthranilate phosphoribosyltransferase